MVTPTWCWFVVGCCRASPVPVPQSPRTSAAWRPLRNSIQHTPNKIPFGTCTCIFIHVCTTTLKVFVRIYTLYVYTAFASSHRHMQMYIETHMSLALRYVSPSFRRPHFSSYPHPSHPHCSPSPIVVPTPSPPFSSSPCPSPSPTSTILLRVARATMVLSSSSSCGCMGVWVYGEWEYGGMGV